VQKALGSKVQTTFKENVPEGPQTAQVIDSLVRDGNKLIFATSFGYQDAMVAAAKGYRLLLVLPGNVSKERIETIRALRKVLPSWRGRGYTTMPLVVPPTDRPH